MRPDAFDDEDEEGVEGNVGEDDQDGRDGDAAHAVVEEAEGKEEGNDDCEGLVHGETGLHDAMVDVGHVGIEHGFAVELAHESHSDDIDAWEEDDGPADEEGLFAIRKACSFVGHLVFDGKVGDDVSEEKAA